MSRRAESLRRPGPSAKDARVVDEVEDLARALDRRNLHTLLLREAYTNWKRHEHLLASLHESIDVATNVRECAGACISTCHHCGSTGYLLPGGRCQVCLRHSI